MYTRIWKPGSDITLDNIFEEYRQRQNLNIADPLHTNYNKKIFLQSAALCITFSDDNHPLILNSILKRDIWPGNTYRICNRLWKVPNERLICIDKNKGLDIVSKAILDQTIYARNTLNADLVFLSRQYNNWQKFVVKQIKLHTGLEFEYDNYKYLTCSNLDDCSCWQPIMYLGNTKLLNQWSRK